MRLIICVVVFTSACSKPNPNLCCDGAADCAANNLPAANTCGDGQACVGHQCVYETCTSSPDCESSTPYCDTSSGLCAAMCSDDSQCPGAAQGTNDLHCVSGMCVECRLDSATDCSDTTPVCASGTCRRCEVNNECSSGACASDGHCVDPAEIAYVAPTGSTTECSQAAPCSLAIGIASTRSYVVLATGTYESTQALVFDGTKTLIGSVPRPLLNRTTPGSIVTVDVNASVTMDNVQVSGATTAGTVHGYGIEIPLTGGVRTLTLHDVVVTGNADDGVSGGEATLTVTKSEFSGNGGSGIAVSDSSSSIDQCRFIQNTGSAGALSLDTGAYSITNSFFIRNATVGAHLYSAQGTAARFDFNTVADNSQGGLTISQADSTMLSTANNLIARNGVANLTIGGCLPGDCVVSSSTIVSTSVQMFNFLSAEGQPYDYHLGSNSVAIDAAVGGDIDHDYDGEMRPKGPARDVGADEAQ